MSVVTPPLRNKLYKFISAEIITATPGYFYNKCSRDSVERYLTTSSGENEGIKKLSVGAMKRGEMKQHSEFHKALSVADYCDGSEFIQFCFANDSRILN